MRLRRPLSTAVDRDCRGIVGGDDVSQERTTIYQVAARAGVSIATVSRVLQGTAPTSESARRKVAAAVEQLGYEPQRPSRRASSARRESIGIVLPTLDSSYISEILLGCGEAASQRGQSIGVVVTERRHDVTAAVQEMVGSVDGLVVVGASVSDAVTTSLSRRLPVVLVGRGPLPGCDSVSADNASCAQRLTSHLIAVHQRSHLVFVGDPDASPDVAERYRGFRLAHAAANIPNRRPPLRVPYVEAAGTQVAEEILRRRVRIDGLCCANDELAIAVMSRLLDSRVAVPEDMSVVGWDDIMTARYVRPSLTTVRQPVRAIGRMAAELLHGRVEGGLPPGEPRNVPSELVIRSSCGCVDLPRQGDNLTSITRRPAPSGAIARLG